MNNQLRVSKNSNSKNLANAISFALRENKVIHIDAIGEKPVYIAVKAIAIARGLLITKGIDFHMITSFGETVINNEEKTFIRFTLERK